MKRRWEFMRYDHRRNGIMFSRGWLHYMGLGPALIVVGFHRSSNSYRSLYQFNAKGRAWVEITTYWRMKGHSFYPGIRIPKRWA